MTINHLNSIWSMTSNFLSHHHARCSEIDSCFTLCRVSCLMTIVASEHQSLCDQKRRRDAIEEEHSTTRTSQPSWKRIKRRHQSQQKTNTAYWNSLFKLWLTWRALNELNRRNRKRVSSVRITVARDLDLSDEIDLLKNFSKKLRRWVKVSVFFTSVWKENQRSTLSILIWKYVSRRAILKLTADLAAEIDSHRDDSDYWFILNRTAVKRQTLMVSWIQNSWALLVLSASTITWMWMSATCLTLASRRLTVI